MTEPIEQEIRTLRSLFWSDRDPDGLAFAPLADAYRRAGQFRQAVELLGNGRVRHPEFATGHLVAARLFMEKGLVEEGELAARKVLELDEDNVLALGLLADALEAKGALPAAEPLRARVRDLTEVEAPTSVEPEDAAVDIAELAPDEPGEPEDAVVDIAELAPDEPGEPEDAVVDIAELAPDEPGEPEDAVVDIAELAPDEPGEPEDADFEDDSLLITRTMADLYARQGFTAEALEVYRQLLQFDSEDQELQRKVATLEAELRGEDEAKTGEGQQGTPAEPGALQEEEPAEHVWQTQAREERHDVDTPFAWIVDESEATAPSGPPISAYFQRLLAWEPAAADAGADDDDGDPRGGDDGDDSTTRPGEDDL